MLRINLVLFLWAFSQLGFANNHITKTQFIHRVLAQEKLLAEAQIGLDIKQIEANASRDNHQNWSLDLSAKTHYNYYDLERETDSNRSYTGKNKGYPKSVGLLAEKRFLSHLGNVKIGVARVKDKDAIWTYKESIETQNYQTNEAENVQFIRYQYPLLKHDSNASSLRTYTRDIIDLKRQKLLFFEDKEAILMEQLLDYLYWIQLHNHQLIQQSLLEDLTQITTHNNKDKIVLQKTIFETKIQFDNITQNLHAIKSKIAILLNDDSILTTTPSADLSAKPSMMKGHKLAQYLQKYSRVLERIRLDITLREINIKYYENRTLPSLDFSIGAINTASNRNTRSNFYNDDRINYNASLEFNMPLGGDIINNSYLQKNQLSIKKLQISYKDKQQDILADTDELNALLMINEAELTQNIENSQQLLALENQSYAEHTSPIRDLIAAYQEFAQSQLLKFDTLVRYQNRRLQYQALLDQLVTLDCANGLATCAY